MNWLPVLAQDTYRQIVLKSLTYLREHKHTQLNAFVVMSTHLHAILWPDERIVLYEDWLYSSARAYLRDEETFPPVDILTL